MLFKDDTLGLGAKLSSKNVEAQRTGLDAFQGLLGRLNSKSEEEVKVLERKGADRKLEVYARGRWGGMVFVPGGVLVQGEGFKSKREAKEAKEARERDAEDVPQEGKDKADMSAEVEVDSEEDDEKTQRRRRKDEQRKRREEKDARKAAKAAKKQHLNPSSKVPPTPDEPTSTSSSNSPDEPTPAPRPTPSTSMSKRKALDPLNPDPPPSTVPSTDAPPPPSPQTHQPLPLPKPISANGRAILRNRNIAAKRKAFQDTKGLDAIFMRS